MAQISKKEVQHIAKLARLELTDQETIRMEKDLSSIFDYFEAIKKLDTKGIEPSFYLIPLTNVFREDKERKDKGVDKILKQAPNKEKRFIKVKEILK